MKINGPQTEADMLAALRKIPGGFGDPNLDADVVGTTEHEIGSVMGNPVVIRWVSESPRNMSAALVLLRAKLSHDPEKAKLKIIEALRPYMIREPDQDGRSAIWLGLILWSLGMFAFGFVVAVG